jgi:glycosyltransferase
MPTEYTKAIPQSRLEVEKFAKMKISIITATYNSLKHLPAVLQSISSQSYPTIEWIVVDGDSTDGTKEFIVENSGTITHWVSEADHGIYDALNKGIGMASGDIIGFLHSDDFFSSPTILEEIAHQFKNPDIDAVYGDLEYVSSTDTNKRIRYWKSKAYHPTLLAQGWMPAHPTLFIKKEVYAKHGFFDLNYRIAADYDLMLRILRDPTLRFTYLPSVITKMRVGGASNTIGNIKRKMQEDYRVICSHGFARPMYILLRKNFSKLQQFYTSKR